MTVTNAEVRRLSSMGILILLAVLAFLILRPIALSIVAGLIFAYAFLPLYKRIVKRTKKRSLSAAIVCAFILVILLVPFWFLAPIIIQQTFDLFTLSQTIDFSQVVRNVFPGTSEQVQREATTIIISFIGKTTTYILNTLTGLFFNLPIILLHLTVIMFVFFFTLRDHDKLREYVTGLSPFRKDKERILTKQFKDVTSSIIFGYIVVGIIQGIAAGIGFFIFGVPKALILTILAVFAAIIPMVGPWLVWVPVAIYMFATGSTAAAVGFTIYSALFVSFIDNFLRPYIVSRKTGTSSVIVLIGMIGGLLVFGILGLILGPLILAYLIVFLTAYRNKTLSDMFSSD